MGQVVHGGEAVDAGREARVGSISVLTYHAVDDVLGYIRHLEYLRHHASPVSLAAAVEILRGRVEAPERAVLVTVDDGDRSILDAAPLMADRNIPGVAFVVAGLLDSSDPCWWAEVRELVPNNATTMIATLKTMPNHQRMRVIHALRERTGAPPVRGLQLRSHELLILEDLGISIGCRSATHPCLDRCDDSEIDEEVGGARRALGQVVGHDPIAYAYPNGNHDARCRAAVEAAGFSVAFGYDGKQADAPTSNLFTVSRIKVDPWEPVMRLAEIVSTGGTAVSALV